MSSVADASTPLGDSQVVNSEPWGDQVDADEADEFETTGEQTDDNTSIVEEIVEEFELPEALKQLMSVGGVSFAAVPRALGMSVATWRNCAVFIRSRLLLTTKSQVQTMLKLLRALVWMPNIFIPLNSVIPTVPGASPSQTSCRRKPSLRKVLFILVVCLFLSVMQIFVLSLLRFMRRRPKCLTLC